MWRPDVFGQQAGEQAGRVVARLFTPGRCERQGPRPDSCPVQRTTRCARIFSGRSEPANGGTVQMERTRMSFVLMTHRRRPARIVVTIALVLCVLSWRTIALAGTTGALSGVVSDAATRQPLAGARVTATSPSKRGRARRTAAGTSCSCRWHPTRTPFP
jgi:hypothetical protein